MSLTIGSSPLGPYETNIYLVTDNATRHCVVIDAPPDGDELIFQTLRKENLTLDALLLTHGHWDHIATAHAFAKAGIPIYAHKADAPCYESPEQFLPFYRASIPSLSEQDFQRTPITHWLTAGEKLKLLGREIEVRHVPGHCPGNVLFYFPEEKWAFPGDAIFESGVGRTDLLGGDWATLLHSIRTQIYTLPDDTRLFPGHGGETLVSSEKRDNPYARPA